MNKKSLSAAALCATVLVSLAFGASIHVAPVAIQLAPGQSSGVLTLTNEGDKPLHAQVRVFAWNQATGSDSLDPTDALVASPPMIDIAPQASQTIRLVRTIKSVVAKEESYRVLIDEIIDPATATATGVNLQLRYSVPVFASPAGMRPPRTTVTANVSGQTVSLKVQNRGGQHANVSAVTLENTRGESVTVEPGLVGYALVGRTMQWKLQLPPDGAAKAPFVRLRCRFNGEDFSTKL